MEVGLGEMLSLRDELGSCWVEERRALLERRRTDGVELVVPVVWFPNFGMLRRNSLMSNCLCIRNGFRSFPIGITLALIVINSVVIFTSSSSPTPVAILVRRRLVALMNASAVAEFPRYA